MLLSVAVAASVCLLCILCKNEGMREGENFEDDGGDGDAGDDEDENDDDKEKEDDGASRCEGEHYVATHFAATLLPSIIQCNAMQ